MRLYSPDPPDDPCDRPDDWPSDLPCEVGHYDGDLYPLRRLLGLDEVGVWEAEPLEMGDLSEPFDAAAE